MPKTKIIGGEKNWAVVAHDGGLLCNVSHFQCVTVQYSAGIIGRVNVVQYVVCGTIF